MSSNTAGFTRAQRAHSETAPLHAGGLTQTPPNAVFDDLTRLASTVCQTPLSLLALDDGSQVWFHTNPAIAPPYTPPNFALDARLWLQPDGVTQLPDARDDAHFHGSPWITAQTPIVFIASTALVTAEGHALGVLCAMDYAPRTLTPAQQDALMALARQASVLLGLHQTVTRLTEQEQRHRILVKAVEQCPVSIVITDKEACIEYVNPKFLALTGYALDEVIGKNPRFLQSGETPRDTYSTLWKTIQSGAMWHGVFHNRKRSGALFWEQASISPIADDAGKTTHYLAVKEDITLLRASQEQLDGRNAELKQFAHTLSHDLKAPLRGITGYAQEVVRKHQEGLPERAQFCMKQVLIASRNMNQLIDDLLAYVRIDAEVMVKTGVNLQVLVQSLVKDHAPAISAHGTVCLVDVPNAVVPVWERGIRQVLNSLIDNAIKFSVQATPPTVTIAATLKDGQCQLRVTDNGIGFDMKYQDRIFGLFNRLVRTSEFEGTGAGLALSKKLVDKMGGALKVETALGQGATFSVSLACPEQAIETPH